MRIKSRTWAHRVGPALILGLFTLISAVATAQAQPQRGQPRFPGAMIRGGAKNMARGRGVTPSTRALLPGARGAKPRFVRGMGAGRKQINRPGVRHQPRRGAHARRRAQAGQRRGKGRRPGRIGRPSAGARKIAVPSKAPSSEVASKPKKASQTEAQRLAKLKAANQNTPLVGAVTRKTKTKGGLMNQLLFYVLFSLIICFCLVTITRKSPLMAALSLLVVFLGLAGIYLFLQAPFMAAIQLIVYAGAVIVLFVFVIMSIGFDEERDLATLGTEILYFAMAFMLTGAGAFVFHAGSGLAYVAGFAAMELLALGFIILGKLQYPVTRFLGIAAVTFALAQVVRLLQLSPVLIGKTVGLKTHLDAPKQLFAAPADGSFGNAKAIGQSVFTENVFAFEALSLLLLASVVAAVVIVRSRKDNKEQTS
jgi:NADH:ubiquinone oxidoreductase subunit 6 (subunit J)